MTDSTEFDVRLTDPEAARLVAQWNEQLSALGYPTRRALGVEGTRALARARIARQPAPPPGTDLRIVDHDIATDAGHLAVRDYAVADTAPAGVAVFLHGGGWISGDLDINDGACRQLCRGTGLRVVSLDYALAPEHQFPVALEQAAALVRVLARPPDPLVLAGLSAGGALAAALADRGARGILPRASHLVLLCPVLDCDLSRLSYQENAGGLLLTADDMDWFWQCYLPDRQARLSPDASPLRTEVPAALPATTIVAAGADPLRDEAIAYARLLEAHGVDIVLDLVPGVQHAFTGPGTASGRAAMRRLAERLRRCLPPPALRFDRGGGLREQPCPGEIKGLLVVAHHDRREGIEIALHERLDDAGMLRDALKRAVRIVTQRAAQHHRGDVLKRMQYPHNLRRLRSGIENVMEHRVQLKVPVWLADDRLVNRTQGDDVLRLHVVHQAAGSRRLKCQLDLDHLFEVRELVGPDSGAAMRIKADHPVSCEVVQRLAYRSDAHAELPGDLRLANAGVRLEPPAENRLPEKLIYTTLHRFAGVLVQRVKSGAHARSVPRPCTITAGRERGRPASVNGVTSCAAFLTLTIECLRLGRGAAKRPCVYDIAKDSNLKNPQVFLRIGQSDVILTRVRSMLL
jgi:acetyl esterase